jgi:hypothetical protein
MVCEVTQSTPFFKTFQLYFLDFFLIHLYFILIYYEKNYKFIEKIIKIIDKQCFETIMCFEIEKYFLNTNHLLTLTVLIWR